MTFNGLNERFGIETVGEEETTTTTTLPLSDAEVTREAIRDSIEKSQEIAVEVLRIAKASESPRAFEVAVQAARAIADNAMLLKKSNEEKVGKGEAPKNVNLFVGSTRDLMRAIASASVAEGLPEDTSPDVEILPE